MAEYGLVLFLDDPFDFTRNATLSMASQLFKHPTDSRESSLSDFYGSRFFLLFSNFFHRMN